MTVQRRRWRIKFMELFVEREVTQGTIIPKTITGTQRNDGELMLADKPTKTLVFYGEQWEFHLSDGGCDQYGNSLVNVDRVKGRFIAKSITIREDILKNKIGNVFGDITEAME